jgi:LysM repeat protein
MPNQLPSIYGSGSSQRTSSDLFGQPSAQISSADQTVASHTASVVAPQGSGTTAVTSTKPGAARSGGGTSSSGGAGSVTNTVRPGDTLGNIGYANGTTATAIGQANGIQNLNLIHPGQVLTIPRRCRFGRTPQEARSRVRRSGGDYLWPPLPTSSATLPEAGDNHANTPFDPNPANTGARSAPRIWRRCGAAVTSRRGVALRGVSSRPASGASRQTGTARKRAFPGKPAGNVPAGAWDHGHTPPRCDDGHRESSRFPVQESSSSSISCSGVDKTGTGSPSSEFTVK